MQRQVPTFKKFENSESSTNTVLDKLVGIPAALQRHVPGGISFSLSRRPIGTVSHLIPKWDICGESNVQILGISVELQDMVNDVDIDGDGQRMCFCQAAWQWLL